MKRLIEHGIYVDVSLTHTSAGDSRTSVEASECHRILYTKSVLLSVAARNFSYTIGRTKGRTASCCYTLYTKDCGVLR